MNYVKKNPFCSNKNKYATHEKKMGKTTGKASKSQEIRVVV